MKGHKVVTVERGDGYAARCTVVVDGVETLCDITFGGFRTRTEAREALTHEEAPGAVGAAAEGVTPTKGIHMDTPNVAQSATEHGDGIDAVRPSWATEQIHAGELAVTFSATFGVVSVSRTAFFAADGWALEDVRVELPENGPEGGCVPVDAVPALIADLSAAHAAVAGRAA